MVMEKKKKSEILRVEIIWRSVLRKEERKTCELPINLEHILESCTRIIVLQPFFNGYILTETYQGIPLLFSDYLSICCLNWLYIRQLIFMVNPFLFQQRVKIPIYVIFAIWLEQPPETKPCHHHKLIIPISSFLSLWCYSQAGTCGHLQRNCRWKASALL